MALDEVFEDGKGFSFRLVPAGQHGSTFRLAGDLNAHNAGKYTRCLAKGIHGEADRGQQAVDRIQRDSGKAESVRADLIPCAAS